MEIQTIDSIAKTIPPYEAGKENAERREFFKKIIQWSGYANEEEYPFENVTEKILDALLRMDGEDRIECLIELLSTVRFEKQAREKAFKEAEKILDSGSFDGQD